MPHVIYLHSALTNGRMPCRDDEERSRVLRFERLDVIIALGLAGLVNMAMLAVAAKLFHTHALSGLRTIGEAHAQFGHLVGGTAALAFAVALLASGASSSSVGTYAGQVVMAGFIDVRIPLMVRRAVTMIPALVVLAVGVSPTSALVLSQVVLSFGIPLALVPLVMLTGRRDVMGVHVNRRLTTIARVGLRDADQRAERVPALQAVLRGLNAQRPNQRARRVEPKRCLSITPASVGSPKAPVGFGPERKSTSTRPTRPAPNSM